MPSGATVPIGARNADSGEPSRRPSRRPEEEADDRGHELGGRQLLARRGGRGRAGMTVRYGRSEKPSTVQATTQPTTTAPRAGHLAEEPGSAS